MKDDRIRYRPAEQRAALEAGAPCFCLHPSKDLTGEQMAEALGTALPKILGYVDNHPEGGYIKGVNRQGRLRHLFPRSGR